MYLRQLLVSSSNLSFIIIHKYIYLSKELSTGFFPYWSSFEVCASFCFLSKQTVMRRWVRLKCSDIQIFFFVCHNMGAGSQSLWAALSLKQKCSTQVSPIKEQGWLNVWYLLDDWESTTKQTIFLITHCTIFLPHVCFIMAQLFKATLGNTLPLSVWKKSMEARKQNGPIKLCSLPISNYLMQCCSMLEQDVRHFDVCPHWLWLKQQASII